MPELTRRRSLDAREECWPVYYGDVHAGTISIRTGNPHDTNPWEWHCGFYPGSHPGEHTNGTAPTFEEARADFERAWAVFLSNRTERDFQAYRDGWDWHAWKYTMWDASLSLPTQNADGRARCFCGAGIDIASLHRHVLERHGSRCLGI
jgi:hypothetical protein